MSVALQEVIESLPLGLALVSRSLRYESVNFEYSEMFECTPAEIVGKEVKEFLPASTLSHIEPHLEAVLQGQTTEFEIGTGEGLRASRYVRYVPVASTGGFVAVFSREMTQAQYFRKGVEIATATVNHHINNSLVMLMHKVEKIKRKHVTDDIEEELKRIHQSTNKILEVLRQMQHYEDLKLEKYADRTYVFKIEED